MLIQEVMEIQMMTMTRMVTNLIMMMMYVTRGMVILVEEVEDQELEEHLMEMGEGLVAEMMEDGDQEEVHFNARIVKNKKKSMLSFFF